MRNLLQFSELRRPLTICRTSKSSRRERGETTSKSRQYKPKEGTTQRDYEHSVREFETRLYNSPSAERDSLGNNCLRIQISTSSASEYGTSRQFGWVRPVIRSDNFASKSLR